jgi:hypothetical protein
MSECVLLYWMQLSEGGGKTMEIVKGRTKVRVWMRWQILSLNILG